MSGGMPWTPAEESWLRGAYPTHHNAALTAMHAELFPDRPRTAKAIASRAKVLGLRKAEGFVRNPRTLWTPEREAWFRAYVPGNSESEIAEAFAERFGIRLTRTQIKNGKATFGVKSGTVGGRFEKGNAGGFRDEAHRQAFIEAGKRTRFKRGEIHVAPSRQRPVGYERVDAKDGYVWVKVRDSAESGPQRTDEGFRHNENYELKHHVVYRQAYGEIPEGCNIVFADHDKRNFDPANLVAVPRSIWSIISRKHMAFWDAESLRTCMAAARLDQARHAAECRPRPCRRCGREFEARYPHQRTCDACLGRAGR